MRRCARRSLSSLRIARPRTDLFPPHVAQEFSRTVSTAEGQAFAASRDPPWMFMECSAKKGGEDVSGADGIFSKVVDQVRPRIIRLRDSTFDSISLRPPPLTLDPLCPTPC